MRLDAKQEDDACRQVSVMPAQTDSKLDRKTLPYTWIRVFQRGVTQSQRPRERCPQFPEKVDQILWKSGPTFPGKVDLGKRSESFQESGPTFPGK